MVISMLIAIDACFARWWVWPRSPKSGAAMAAMLGLLPTPLDQEPDTPGYLCIEHYRCSFAAFCSCVSVALLS